jgi:hypothetical protein
MFLGALAICGSISTCTTIQHPKHSPDVSRTIKSKDVRGATEHSINAFDPKYFKKLGHMAIPFTITPEGLRLLSPEKKVRAGLRPGPSPFRPGGDTLVVYRDVKKEEIGYYSIEDPTKGRSCDLTDKGGGKVFDLKEGEDVELLFPANPDIASIVIVYADKDPQVFNVSKIVIKVFEKTPKNVLR